MRSYKAFSLIEILIVIFIITTLAVVSSPVALSSVFRANSSASAQIIMSNLFKQQQDAFNGFENLPRGVQINSNNITLYTGTSIQTGTVIKTINLLGTSISTNIPSSDVNFSLNSLYPSQVGEIYITSGGITNTVVLNSAGLIYVE